MGSESDIYERPFRWKVLLAKSTVDTSANRWVSLVFNKTKRKELGAINVAGSHTPPLNRPRAPSSEQST